MAVGLDAGRGERGLEVGDDLLAILGVRPGALDDAVERARATGSSFAACTHAKGAGGRAAIRSARRCSSYVSLLTIFQTGTGRFSSLVGFAKLDEAA